jgi:hypothetical protein
MSSSSGISTSTFKDDTFWAQLTRKKQRQIQKKRDICINILLNNYIELA